MPKKKAVRQLRTDKNTVINFYIIFSAVAVFLSIELAMFSRGDSLRDSMFWNGWYTDHFMDFFNTLRDSRDLTWVYQRNVIYPPLSVLFMYCMTKFLPEELASLYFSQRMTMQASQAAVMLYFFFAVCCLLLLAVMIEKYMHDSGVGAERFAVVLFSIVSFPVIYCMERGNTSLLATVGCAFFLFFRNSKSKGIREVACIMLALAAGIKLFPSVLGVLLIYDRQYKRAARTVLYGILMIAVPYLLIQLLMPESGGIADAYVGQSTVVHSDGSIGSTDGSILRLAKNLIRWVNKRNFFSYNSTSISNFVFLAQSQEQINAQTASILSVALFLLTEVLAFLLGFVCKKEWQRQFLALYMMLNIHSIAMHYTLIYIIPVFIVFLCDRRQLKEKPRALKWIYFLLFAAQVVSLPYILYGMRGRVSHWLELIGLPAVSNFNKFFSCFAFQLLALLVVLDIVTEMMKRKKKGI